MTLGELVRTRRKALGLTLEQTADAIGCSKSYIWEVENHKGYKISLLLAARLAIGLGLRVSMLAAALESEKEAK